MARIKSDPDWALDMAVRAQEKFCQSYLLDKQLEVLFQQHPTVLSSTRSQVLARGSEPVDVLAAGLRNTDGRDSLLGRKCRSAVLSECASLVGHRQKFPIETMRQRSMGCFADSRAAGLSSKKRCSKQLTTGASRVGAWFRPDASSRGFRARLRGGYVAFMGGSEEWFTDHLSALARVLDGRSHGACRL